MSQIRGPGSSSPSHLSFVVFLFGKIPLNTVLLDLVTLLEGVFVRTGNAADTDMPIHPLNRPELLAGSG